MKFIAFDTEAFTLEEPKGISVAVTCQDKQQARIWRSGTLDECLPLSPQQAIFLVEYLKISADRGYTILTWNGLGYDFKILGEVSGLWEDCAALALNHVDMMFQFFCRYGYRVGQDAIAHGLGLPGKDGHEDVEGANAPIAWHESKAKRIKVCEYCEADGTGLLAIAKAITEQGYYKWTTRAGRPMKRPYGGAWRTVAECLAIRLPDVSWIPDPHTREEIMDWIFKVREV